MAAFLSCCLGTDDFGIGIRETNRGDARDLTTIEYSLNTLPLRYAVRAVTKEASSESLRSIRGTRCTSWHFRRSSTRVRAPLKAIWQQAQLVTQRSIYGAEDADAERSFWSSFSKP